MKTERMEALEKALEEQALKPQNPAKWQSKKKVHLSNQEPSPKKRKAESKRQDVPEKSVEPLFSVLMNFEIRSAVNYASRDIAVVR